MYVCMYVHINVLLIKTRQKIYKTKRKENRNVWQ